jgi:hypothetical protein
MLMLRYDLRLRLPSSLLLSGLPHKTCMYFDIINDIISEVRMNNLYDHDKLKNKSIHYCERRLD